MDTVEEKQVDINMEMPEEAVAEHTHDGQNNAALTAEEQESQKTMQAYDELLEIKEKVCMRHLLRDRARALTLTTW